MENKKLFKFLLKDLGEIDELFSEKNSSTFDELEIEFLCSRIKGATKLVQILAERENNSKVETKEQASIEGSKIMEEADKEQESLKEAPVAEEIDRAKMQKEHSETFIKDEYEEGGREEDQTVEIQEDPKDVTLAKKEEEPQDSDEVELGEEELVDAANNRLGDSFSKEKSINDLIYPGSNKLEHQLSNRPISSLQSAIGINDRFQYIRELFNGSAENFSKAVIEIDTMHNLKEAVAYLQQNYSWKKNETSLKFVSLVKRRFPHA